MLPRRRLQVRWHQFVRTLRSSQPPVFRQFLTLSLVANHHLRPCTRLEEEVPAHKAIRCHVDLALGQMPTREWKRPPARHAAGGLTRSGRTTTTLQLQTSGGMPLNLIIEERCYGLRRLCSDDDDDDDD